jgi:hypothetical protein
MILNRHDEAWTGGAGGFEMGYDIHITRARDWTESEKTPVALEEWLGAIRAASDLEVRESRHAAWTAHPGRLDVPLLFDRGEISIKNPDEPTLARAIALAQALNARVVGDDGEVYERPDVPPRPAAASFGARVSSWLGHLRFRQDIEADPLPFRVGDRVRDSWGNEATVIYLDTKAEHGLGVVKVRYDDGRELQSAAVAHGLTKSGT